MRARCPGDVGLDAIERAPVGVDAVDDDMAIESPIVAGADAPARAGLPDREALDTQGLALEVAFAADLRPSSGDVAARDKTPRQRLRGAIGARHGNRRREQRCERVEPRRID